jgi:outer membrane protein TolC
MFRPGFARITRVLALPIAALMNPAVGAEPLSLDEAVTLALENQPLLLARAAEARAAREAAVAESQLPDPRLEGGVTDLTIEGADRFNVRDEAATQFMLGLSQSFPRGRTRHWKGARGRAQADQLDAQREMRARQVRRDTALAWLDAWKAERAADVARRAVRESELELQATELAYTAGRARQADVLAARVALGRMRDEADDFDQQAWHGRSELSRWIGEASERPLGATLPAWPPPPALDQILDALRSHPHLLAEGREVEVARAEVELARQGYKPEIDVTVGYGYRPEFTDYASLTIGMDLPVFTGKRQDRALAAKLAAAEGAEQMREDGLREHAAEARLNLVDWTRLQQRLARFDAEILPHSTQRVDAALASWRAGTGTLAAVLDARRAALEHQLKKLELELDAARHRVNLLYLAGA